MKQWSEEIQKPVTLKTVTEVLVENGFHGDGYPVQTFLSSETVQHRREQDLPLPWRIVAAA
jgi:hypothetical protein